MRGTKQSHNSHIIIAITGFSPRSGLQFIVENSIKLSKKHIFVRNHSNFKTSIQKLSTLKKIFLLSILFITSFAFSQKNDSIQNIYLNKKNEVRVNLTKVLISKRIEISYERFLNKKISTGLSILFLKENIVEFLPFYCNDCENYAKTNDYQVIPYIRYSFSKNTKRNWYWEIFSSINSGKYKTVDRLFDGTYGYYDKVEKQYTNVALGSSIGYKFYIKKKFVVDLHFGLAPNLLSPNYGPDVVTRIGGNVGYRF